MRELPFHKIMKQTLKALECNLVALQTHLRETTLMDYKEFCNVQCLYSTDVETGFPLHDLQGQWTWVYESSLQWQRTISLRSQLLFLPAISCYTTKLQSCSRQGRVLCYCAWKRGTLPRMIPVYRTSRQQFFAPKLKQLRRRKRSLRRKSSKEDGHGR